MPFPWENYIIEGYVPDFTSGTVTATNKTTAETQTTDIQSDSTYLIDCANFTASGWSEFDIIELTVPGRSIKTTIDKTQHPGRIQVDILGSYVLLGVAGGNALLIKMYGWYRRILSMNRTKYFG